MVIKPPKWWDIYLYAWYLPYQLVFVPDFWTINNIIASMTRVCPSKRARMSRYIRASSAITDGKSGQPTNQPLTTEWWFPEVGSATSNRGGPGWHPFYLPFTCGSFFWTPQWFSHFLTFWGIGHVFSCSKCRVASDHAANLAFFLSLSLNYTGFSPPQVKPLNILTIHSDPDHLSI